MGTTVYGYLRRDVATDRLVWVEQMLQDFGELYGLGVVRVFVEPGPTTDTLDTLLDALTETGGRQHVVIPTEAHLDGLPVSRQELLHQFSSRGARVWCLSSEQNRVEAGHRPMTGPDVNSPSSGGGLVGEFSCRALPTADPVARLHLHEDLTRAGLGEMVPAAEAVVVSVIGAAVRASAAAVTADPPGVAENALFNQLTVRVSRTPGELLVQIHETREHTDEPLSRFLAEYGRAGREHRDGGTTTWCALSLDPVAARRRDGGGLDGAR